MFESDDREVSIAGKAKEEGPRSRTRFNWKTMPVSELLGHYEDIRQALPPSRLEDLNMEEELTLQFHTMKSLQADCLSEEETPLNQRVALANSVASLLDRLIEAQGKVYDQERFKAIENLLIRHARQMPEELAERFLSEYADLLDRFSKKEGH